MNQIYLWHIHHETLLEFTTEPIENRITYIKSDKPAYEIETRLRLLKPVKGKLPTAVVEAGEAYGKAWEACREAWEAYTKAKAWDAYDKALDAYGKAGEAYGKALQDHRVEIEALHASECPGCSWNGETIFP